MYILKLRYKISGIYIESDIRGAYDLKSFADIINETQLGGP